MSEIRNDPFAPLGGLSALSPWQDYWRLWADMQQTVMQSWLSGWAGLLQAGPLTGGQAPAWPTAFPKLWEDLAGGMPGVPGLAAFGNLAAFMPRVDAVVTPLETKGALAGADEAARLSMRMAFPGCMGPAEMVLVEAVIARAPAEAAAKLTQASRDLLPKQDK